MDILTFYYVVFSPLTAQAVLMAGGLSLGLAAGFIVLFRRCPAACHLSRFAPTSLGRGLATVQGWALSLRGAQRLLPAVILYALACVAYAWDAPEMLSVWQAASVYSLSLVAFLLALSSFLWGPRIDDALRQIGGKRAEPSVSAGSLAEQVSALRSFEGRPAPPGLFPLLYQSMVARLQNLRLRAELPWRWRTLLLNGLHAACLVLLSWMLFGRAGSLLVEAVEPLHDRRETSDIAPSFPPESPPRPQPAETRAEESARDSGKAPAEPREERTGSPAPSGQPNAGRKGTADSGSTPKETESTAGETSAESGYRKETKTAGAEPRGGLSAQEHSSTPKSTESTKSTPSTSQPTAGAEDQAAPREPPGPQTPPSQPGPPRPTCSSPSCSAAKPCESCASSASGALAQPVASQGGQKSEPVAQPDSAAPSQTPEELAESGKSSAPAFEPGKAPGRQPVPGASVSQRDEGTKRPGEETRISSTPPQDPNKSWGTGIGPPVEGAHRPSEGDRAGTEYEEMKLPGQSQGPESLAARDFDPEAKAPLKAPGGPGPRAAGRHNPTMELRPNRYVEPLPLSPQRVPAEYRAAFHKLFQRNE